MKLITLAAVLVLLVGCYWTPDGNATILSRQNGDAEEGTVEVFLYFPWYPDTTYDVGARVHYFGDHYVSLKAENAGNVPPESPGWWTATD